MRDLSRIRDIDDIELPTLGHFLEDGFCDPRIRRVGPAPRMSGIALTVDLTVPDAVAVNRALLEAAPGDVLVIRVAGGRHAPVGAVTVAAAIAQGVAGIVIDGPVTDLTAVREAGLPVYSDGSTCVTTKLLGSEVATIGGTVDIGGVGVRRGDLVMGDENGILILPPEGVSADILERARRSDAAEPGLIQRIASGEPLESLLILTAPSYESSAQKDHFR